MAASTVTPGPPPVTKGVLLHLLNGLFALILRSPLHGLLSKDFMLLSFKGRKSGKVYTIVVGYSYDGDVIEIISPAGWWKNIRGDNTSVTMLLKRQWCQGIAEAFHGDETVTSGYLRAMKRSRILIRMYHVEVDAHGEPKRESVRVATRNTSLVRIRLVA